MNKLVLIALTSIFATSLTMAEKTPKEAYNASCLECHGADGAGGKQSGEGPNLTALKDKYATEQFVAIRTGKRKGEGTKKMNEFLKTTAKLTEAELASALKYALELPEAAPRHVKAGDAAAGKGSYALCGTCHGPKGEGYINPAVPAPRLTGQPNWYIVDQVKNFKAGHRGNDTPGGMQMKAMSMTLPTEDAMKNVAAYISTLKK